MIPEWIVIPIRRIFGLIGLELNYLGFESEMRERLNRNPSNPVDVHKLRDEIYSSPGIGVLHIGAHRGQEAKRYEEAGARVLWVEADPRVFQELKENISRFDKQKAVNALLGDVNKDASWYVASNEGESSSVFNLAEDNPFPITMTSRSKIKMQRLDSLFNGNDLIDYPHWVIDVQGAELLVLDGAGGLMDVCMSIEVEVSTLNHYKEAPPFEKLNSFLLGKGFVPLWSPKGNTHEDIIYFRAQPTPTIREK